MPRPLELVLPWPALVPALVVELVVDVVSVVPEEVVVVPEEVVEVVVVVLEEVVVVVPEEVVVVLSAGVASTLVDVLVSVALPALLVELVELVATAPRRIAPEAGPSVTEVTALPFTSCIGPGSVTVCVAEPGGFSKTSPPLKSRRDRLCHW